MNQIRAMALLLTAGACAVSSATDLFLFRGEFIYIIPRVVSEEMARVAGRGDWKHFAEHTRYLDVDNDGEQDFAAVAFGAPSGHGVQIRYRLRRDDDGTLRLGRWYWSVVAAPDGSRMIEEFNP